MNSIEILKHLVQINTVRDNGNRQILNYIESVLLPLGFKTERKEKYLIMSVKDNSKLGFIGHTDTVSANSQWTYHPWRITENGQNLYGLGSCDMKSGIAAMIAALCQTDLSKLKHGITLYFTYDEEIGFSGIKEIVKSGAVFPEYTIVGEPTDNMVISGSKGLLELKLSFLGKSAHSGRPDLGSSAVMKCVSFINEFNDLYYISTVNDYSRS